MPSDSALQIVERLRGREQTLGPTSNNGPEAITKGSEMQDPYMVKLDAILAAVSAGVRPSANTTPVSPALVQSVVDGVKAKVDAAYGPNVFGLYALSPDDVFHALEYQTADWCIDAFFACVQAAKGNMRTAFGSESALAHYVWISAANGTPLPQPTDDTASYVDDPATILANSLKGIAPAGNQTLTGDPSTWPAQLAEREARIATFSPRPPGWEHVADETIAVLCETGVIAREGDSVITPKTGAAFETVTLVAPTPYIGSFADVCNGVWRKPGK